MTSYAKKLTAKANLGEAQQLAQQASYPAIVGTRLALLVSAVAVILSAVALAVAVAK